MKVTPASTAAVSVASASASLTAPQSAPSCQAPRPTTPTERPVRPRMRSSMPPSLVNPLAPCRPTAYRRRDDPSSCARGVSFPKDDLEVPVGDDAAANHCFVLCARGLADLCHGVARTGGRASGGARGGL